MAIKELLSKLVDQQLITGYQVQTKQDKQWKRVTCQLNQERKMVISKLDGDETKQEVQNQIKQYCSMGQFRIAVYYTTERQKIREWVADMEVANKQSLLVICLTEEKEEEFIAELQRII